MKIYVKVLSNESGASHPGTATDVVEPEHPIVEVDNYFGSTFDYFDIHRLLFPVKTTAITTVLANNFPSYDQVVVLVNTPYYGGSGGTYATATTNPASSDVAIHEIGHSFAWLKDEYWAGDIYAAEGINMTQETTPSLVKWKNWIDDNGIGIYQHCCGETSASWYKPHEDCKMQVLGMPFCSVCVEGTIERIHALTNPVVSYTPSEISITPDTDLMEFEIELIEPIPNTFKKRWILNDVELSNPAAAIQISEDELNIGTNILTVIVEDTTELLRIDDHKNIHVFSVSWNIEIITIGVHINESICRGDSIYLQGAYQTEGDIYYDTVLVSGGLDSIFTTTLTVETVDVSVTQTGESLFANVRGATYQWLDCNDFSPVDGATNQSFTPDKNGDYAVEVIQNGCKDTADCYSVATIGMLESSFTRSFKIFPNPTEGRLYISVDKGDKGSDFMIRIIGSDGRTDYFKKMSAPEISIEMSDFGPGGLYYLQLIGPEGGILTVRKIVLNQ